MGTSCSYEIWFEANPLEVRMRFMEYLREAAIKTEFISPEYVFNVMNDKAAKKGYISESDNFRYDNELVAFASEVMRSEEVFNGIYLSYTSSCSWDNSGCEEITYIVVAENEVYGDSFSYEPDVNLDHYIEFHGEEKVFKALIKEWGEEKARKLWRSLELTEDIKWGLSASNDEDVFDEDEIEELVDDNELGYDLYISYNAKSLFYDHVRRKPVNSTLPYEEVESVEVLEGETKIECGAFNNYRSLNSIVLPTSIRSIDEMAFHECDSLESMTLPEDVKGLNNIEFSPSMIFISNSTKDHKDGETYLFFKEYDASFGNNGHVLEKIIFCISRLSSPAYLSEENKELLMKYLFSKKEIALREVIEEGRVDDLRFLNELGHIDETNVSKLIMYSNEKEEIEIAISQYSCRFSLFFFLLL